MWGSGKDEDEDVEDSPPRRGRRFAHIVAIPNQQDDEIVDTHILDCVYRWRGINSTTDREPGELSAWTKEGDEWKLLWEMEIPPSHPPFQSLVLGDPLPGGGDILLILKTLGGTYRINATQGTLV